MEAAGWLMKWKSTEKHLPEEGDTVLCWWGPEDPGLYGVATYARPEHWHDPEDDEDDYRTPEFWMPLPASPRRTERIYRFINQRRMTMLQGRHAGYAGEQQAITRNMLSDVAATSAPQPMSEVQYAAQAADDALRSLEKAVAELVARLEPVLQPEPSQGTSGADRAQRAVSSRMGTALMLHAQQTENLARLVAGTLNRLAL